MEHAFYVRRDYECPECGAVLAWLRVKKFGDWRWRLFHLFARGKKAVQCSREGQHYYAPSEQLVAIEKADV